MREGGETVWAWLGKKGWVSAHAVAGAEYGCGSHLERAHTVRTADGKIRHSYCTQYRDPAWKGKDKPTSRVWERGETVWAWLKGRGWTKARMYATHWVGYSVSVYTGRIRGNSCYLADRLVGLRRRNLALSSRDRPRARPQGIA